MGTKENLQAAFAGESQANRKYLFFAEKADKEGQQQIARLFRAAAAAETVHAKNHLTVLQGIKSTAENVQAAISGEHYEFTKMYPEFIKQAKADKDAKADKSFSDANAVEEIHHKLYQEAADSLASGKKLKEGAYYVCPVCGNTVLGAAPDKCPICSTKGSLFMRVD